MSTDKYQIIIHWSEEDQTFVADVPELLGCVAHGASYAAALRESKKAIYFWIETAKLNGIAIPEPKGRPLFLA